MIRCEERSEVISTSDTLFVDSMSRPTVQGMPELECVHTFVQTGASWVERSPVIEYHAMQVLFDEYTHEDITTHNQTPGLHTNYSCMRITGKQQVPLPGYRLKAQLIWYSSRFCSFSTLPSCYLRVTDEHGAHWDTGGEFAGRCNRARTKHGAKGFGRGSQGSRGALHPWH